MSVIILTRNSCFPGCQCYFQSYPDVFGICFFFPWHPEYAHVVNFNCSRVSKPSYWSGPCIKALIQVNLSFDTQPGLKISRLSGESSLLGQIHLRPALFENLRPWESVQDQL